MKRLHEDVTGKFGNTTFTKPASFLFDYFYEEFKLLFKSLPEMTDKRAAKIVKYAGASPEEFYDDSENEELSPLYRSRSSCCCHEEICEAAISLNAFWVSLIKDWPNNLELRKKIPD
jgi:hypothetical protein